MSRPRKSRPTLVYREESPGVAARQTFDLSQFISWMAYEREYRLGARFLIGTIDWQEDVL